MVWCVLAGLALSRAVTLAELRAMLAKCGGLRVRHEFRVSGDGLVAFGRVECGEDERVCEEVLWALNEALEYIGYTATYRVYPGYRRIDFTAYRGVRGLTEAINTLRMLGGEAAAPPDGAR